MGQSSKCSPRSVNVSPLNLLVIKEPPNVLSGELVAHVSPSNVGTAEGGEAGDVGTEWLLRSQDVNDRQDRGRLLTCAILMLLRKKISKTAIAALITYLLNTKKVVYSSSPKV